MDHLTLLLLIVAALALGMLIAFRKSLHISLKGLGISFSASGSNKDSTDTPSKQEASPPTKEQKRRADASVSPRDKPSIAVLPFDNITGDPAQDYLSDGITDRHQIEDAA